MTAKEIYEKETGDIRSTNQMDMHEWHIRYNEWLENCVEREYETKRIINKIFSKTENGLPFIK